MFGILVLGVWFYSGDKMLFVSWGIKGRICFRIVILIVLWSMGSWG